ncbi:tRNA (adenosine(37)-N6)-threonylcarbamoyltransferase complex dimerization subunit type 1 TsaB [Lutimonas vermicola]|uniref:tRNA (Adenosine(37)-N6)-threonylcarbamoyltransferase complex dimerization subunit type 1 TsaB n=1 Tax=Lutimonas vermicola TaxID=414288 RepID=A0ABU9L466_9FLAO
MGIILNIETATKNCSVSVSKNEEILSLKELNEGKFSHSEKLHSFILEVIDNAGLSMDDLDAVAVSKGPGSYTGLRIGVSAAKGLCYALNKPLISVPTLENIALQISLKEDELAVPLLDARRMEVYSAVYDKDHRQIRATKAEIISETSFQGFLKKGIVYFAGDGAEKCKEVIRHENARFLSSVYPSSREMSIIAARKFKSEDFEDVAYFEPFYLKDFVAGKPKNYFKTASR